MASVDRYVLREVVHRADVTVENSAAQLLLVVTAPTITVVLLFSVGQIYFLFFTIDGDVVVVQFSAAVDQEAYSFGFNEVPAGSYYLVACSDQDHDGYICGAGVG